jgi:hypothetical protein
LFDVGGWIMKINGIEFEDAIWTSDCGGKQDFDFSVLSVSTRYWADFTARPSIFLGDKIIVELPKGEYIKGETEIECKNNVEIWVKEKLTEIINKII